MRGEGEREGAVALQLLPLRRARTLSRRCDRPSRARLVGRPGAGVGCEGLGVLCGGWGWWEGGGGIRMGVVVLVGESPFGSAWASRLALWAFARAPRAVDAITAV